MRGNIHGPITEINMTPFVDIVLVILIIFLLTATVMLPRTFSIALPKAAQADKLESVPVIVSIDREGKVAINGNRLSRDSDFDQVFQSQKQGKEALAIIAADQDTRHGRLTGLVAVNTTHGIVLSGLHGHGLLGDVHTGKTQGNLVNPRQAFENTLGSEMR